MKEKNMVLYFFVFLGIIVGVNVLLAALRQKKINFVFVCFAPLLTIVLFLGLAPIGNQRPMPEGPCGNPAAAYAFIQMLRWGIALLFLIPTLAGTQLFLNRLLLEMDVFDAFKRKTAK